jgi:hypothetical protein
MSRSRTGLGFGVLLAVVMAGGQGLAAHGASSRAPSASATARAVAPAVTAVVTRLSDFDRDGFTDLVASQLGGALWLYPGNGAGGFKARLQMGVGWHRDTTARQDGRPSVPLKALVLSAWQGWAHAAA